MSVLPAIASVGRHAAFHSLAAACAVTGATVMLTAGDLGALGAPLIAGGFYAILFGVIAEASFGLRHATAALAGWLIARRGKGRAR